MSEVRIVTLTPDRVETFTGFFDGDIFADKPDWASCYCHAFYFDRSTGAHWSTRTAAENRAASCGMISEGRMSGLFAVVEDRVVGWCNAARKSDMTAFADDPTPGFDNDQVVFMSCFMVAPSARGQGAARQMCMYSLEAARALGYRAMQFNLVLASNVRAVALWERLGFAIAGTLPDVFDHPNLGMVDAHVMRKAL